MRLLGQPARLMAVTALCLSASTASAHDMWVNADSASDAEDGTTTVVTSMGWGHKPLPIAEFIEASLLETYAVVGPDGSMMALPVDASANASLSVIPGEDAPEGLAQMQGGDTFTRRLVFDETAQAGAWRAHAGLPAGVYSTWVNADGQRMSGSKFEDEIEDATEIVSSAVTVRSSDTYWTVGDWMTPQSADVPLQLIPQTDMSSVGVGEEIVVSIYRDGKRISAPADAEFAAYSETAAATGSVDEAGELRISLPEAGTWILRSRHLEDVAEAGPDYGEFEGRIDAITFTATMAVDVEPSLTQ